jgi:hypothetical protein
MYPPQGLERPENDHILSDATPHAWLKSGAIQPAKWFPFPRAEIFALPGHGPFHSPHRLVAVTSVICVRMHASLFVRVGKSFGRLPVLPEENNGS